MEKENITLDPRSSFTPSSSADIPVPPDGLVQRSTRIKRIQTTAMLLLFFAAVMDYLDRSSLSVANLTIREELGLSATEIGALLLHSLTGLRNFLAAHYWIVKAHA
ncbi:hypothetical protein ACLK11_25075 [Escherichia coli]